MCPLIAYIRGKFAAFFAPGKFLQTVEWLLLLALGMFIMFDGIFESSKKYNWIIPQVVYGILCGASFYLAIRVDARNPPQVENSTKNRMIAFCSIIFFLAILEWSMRNVVRKMSFEAYVGHLVAIYTALSVRFVYVFSMLCDEIPLSISRIRCIELWSELGLFFLTISLYILHIYLQESHAEYIIFLMVRTFLFCSTVSIAHVVAGKYRTVAIHEPVQYVLNMVQVV